MEDLDTYYDDNSEEEEEDYPGYGSDEDQLDFSEGETGAHASAAVALDTTTCQALTPDLISKKMFEIIDEVNAVFQLPTPHVRILLTTCKWDKEKLLERYYAGDQMALFKEAHLVHPHTQHQKPKLTTKQPKLRAQATPTCGAAASPGEEYGCEICTLFYSLSEMQGLECGHLYCRGCWESYLTVMVVDQGRGQTIYCPTAGCDIVADEKTVLGLLQKTSVRQKYQLLITNSFVQDHPSLKWCPAPGCPNAVLAHNVHHAPVTCSCGHSFCFKCSRNPHEPIQCHRLRQWLKKCDDDSETSHWIHCNTKECPKCRATIEKNGGCNHMVCSTCKAEFCWVCQGPWEPHGSSWYHCNRFDDNDSKAARNAQDESRSALQRYLHYCNRYMNHLKSSRMETKLYDMAHQRMVEMQQLNMSWIEAQFLKRAVDVLCQCRNTLMYTYSFAYYLVKSNHTLIFEDNQRDLEMATETLSEYLERDITKDSLSNIKIFVQDKTKYCEARRTCLLEHVYEGYEQEFWEYV